MKKLRYFAICIMAMLSTFACIAGPPSDAVKVGSLYYQLNNGNKTASVTYDTGESQTNRNYPSLTTVSIPETIVYSGATYTVTEIGNFAFSGASSLRGVSIPTSVKRLGERAFFKTGLTSIDIPSSVTALAPRCLAENSSLTLVTGMQGVTDVYENAFSGSNKITSLSFPKVETMGFSESGTFTDTPFYGCSALSSINLGNSLVEIAGSNAFSTTAIRNIVLPSSLVAIGYNPFYNSADMVVECKGTTPPTMSGNYNLSTLKVPVSAESKYRSAEGWKTFKYINPVSPTSISINKSSVTIEMGSSTILAATLSPADAVGTISWTTDDTSIATVTNGRVTAVGIGTTYIRANCGTLSASCEVTVTPVQAQSVKLNTTTATLIEAETLQLQATVSPANTTDKTITWSSSSPSIATVNSDGLVTAVKAGNTIITATCGSVSASCTIKVEAPAPTLTLDKTSATIKDSQSLWLVATVNPSTVSDIITWSTSDASIASISSSPGTRCYVSGEKKGVAVITATCGDLKASCTITVTDTPVTGLTLQPSECSLHVGESINLVSTVTPSNASNKTVTYVSNKPSVASVLSDGLVTAISTGTAVITAKCGDFSATATVTVTAPVLTSIKLSVPKNVIMDSESVTVTPTFEPEGIEPPALTWKSSNTSIATVSNLGVVSGVKPGKVTITATAGNINASIYITVVATPAQSITLNLSQTSLIVNETIQLEATVLPANTTDATVTWTSGNEAIVSVSSDGVVTAKGVGTTIITASCGDVSATCKVTVLQPAGSVEIDFSASGIEGNALTLNVGESKEIKVTVTPADSTDTLTWTSSDSSVASVDSNGKVTALKAGEATITVTTTSGKSATLKVTVLQPAGSIEIDFSASGIEGNDITLNVGESKDIKVTACGFNRYPDMDFLGFFGCKC